jgi:hypothetical protein
MDGGHHLPRRNQLPVSRYKKSANSALLVTFTSISPATPPAIETARISRMHSWFMRQRARAHL